MKTTPQGSAGFAQTAWVAYGMSRRGALAIRRDDRADAGRRTTRVACTRSSRRRRRPRYAYLVRRTGRIAGWREWRRNRARANRYSQEERVTSRRGPYAECYAMSNVIGSLGDERERVVVLKLLKPVAADSVPARLLAEAESVRAPRAGQSRSAQPHRMARRLLRDDADLDAGTA
jgi:hypothetical protein